MLIIDGGSSRTLELPVAGSLVLGREEGADIRIEDPAASRRHARLTVTPDRVTITDLDSHNGSWVNGQRIEGGRSLFNGDVVTIGGVTLVLRDASAKAGRARLLDLDSFRERVEEERARATRPGRPFVVASVFGEEVGPEATTALLKALRRIDVLGTSGTQGYLLLLPEQELDEARTRVTSAVEAIAAHGTSWRAGLAAFPDDGMDAGTLISRAQAAATSRENSKVRAAMDASQTLNLGGRTLLVADAAMSRLYELVRRLARGEVNVLIQGETGSGKENVAFALHHWSSRSQGPFVSVNCAALPETLAESQFFGHERGAFSDAVTSKAGLLEAAHGGTLFLDELAELSPAVQAKLLRAIETKRFSRLGELRERQVDVRVVAATHRDLRKEVAQGRFREDLYYRLCAATVLLPPLRERPAEIALLARAFLSEACQRIGQPPPELTLDAIEHLLRWRWPGNVRELRNAMEFVAATCADPQVEPWHLPATLTEVEGDGPGSRSEAPLPPEPRPAAETSTTQARLRNLSEEVKELEQRRIREALELSGGVQTRAAELIGMPLRTLVTKLKYYGIHPRRPER